MEETLLNQELLLAEHGSELDHMYLTFFAQRQLFGVPIRAVEQIVSLPQITTVPEYPDYMKGVVDLRGEIVPLLDVRLRLGLPQGEYGERTCVIVLRLNGRLLGFIVDAVDEVAHVDPEQVSPPPRVSGGVSGRYLTGVARLREKLVLLLDPAKVLSEGELAAAQAAARR